MRARVRSQFELIVPTSEEERAQWLDALAWIDSGAPLFRTAKPATPPKHLVSYFPVVDVDHILLVDHKNAGRWLPTGGHVEVDEDPRTTVIREIEEELGIEITMEAIERPILATVTETVGATSGHVDVSLWYPVYVSRATPLSYDESEFTAVRWFPDEEAKRLLSDPNLGMFLSKLRAGA